MSPDFSRLAYFTYDPTAPSLTAGAVKPANTLNVLTLAGRAPASCAQCTVQRRVFEFLAPDVAWQGNDRLLTARESLCRRFDGAL